MMRRLVATSALAAVSAVGCDRGPARSADYANIAAESLAARSNCTACHDAPAATIERIRPVGAPTMDAVGARVYGPWMAEFIASGAHAGDGGTRMPDLLHGMEKDTRERTAVAIAGWLSTRGAFSSQAITVSDASLVRGERLVSQVGCLACHTNGFDAVAIARKWSLGSLAEFLEHPMVVRASGHMPSMLLSREEATDMAAWLLRAQSGTVDPPTVTLGHGLQAEYFEGAFDGTGPDSGSVAKRLFTANLIEIPADARKDAFALRFTGALDVPRSGEWTFYLSSDDGSAMWLDGSLFIDHGGIHGPGEKSSTRRLEQGAHEIRVQYFEAAGDASLGLEWSGPDTPRQGVPATAYTTRVVTLTPGPPVTAPDEALLAFGKSKWTALGCANCHEPAVATLRAKPLAELDPTLGCLAPEVTARAPQYGFTARERELLQSLVANHEALATPLTPSASIAHTMDRLNCVACHARDGVGGVPTSLADRFTCDADLGDEGRLPPALTGVGGKLQPAAIGRVLDGTERVRPYMNTRMPNFGVSGVAHLVSAFAAADPPIGSDAEPPYSEDAVHIGQQIVGTGGASCVNCHTLGEHASLGVPAVNLASMHARIRPSWFRAYALDPQRFRPGTRMPTFWPKGERVYAGVAGGDPLKQVDGVWAYLSLGGSMPLPQGLAVRPGEFDLEPIDRTIVFGTFMDGLSARCHAIGFPERVSAVYDADHLRLARAWKGKFMNAEGTWRGRAGQLSDPAGGSLIELAPSPALAVLGDPNAPWPRSDECGFRYLGMQRDAFGRPTFSIGRDGLRLDESVRAVLFTGGARLVREYAVHSASVVDGLSLLLAEGRSIVKEGEGWRIDGGPVLFVAGARPIVRTTGGRAELVAGVGLQPGSSGAYPFTARVSTELTW